MDIWIEDVVVDNLIIDTLILLTVKHLARQNTKKWRIFLSSVFGTAIALLSPILPNFANILIKPCVAGIMVLIAFDTKCIKNFCAIYLLFFLSTFAFGGASIGICELLGIEYQIGSNISYQNQVPIGVILLICTVVYFCLKNAINLCFSAHKLDKYKFEITIQTNCKSLSITAFLDTGNLLVFDKKPITIINYQTFCKIYPKIKFEDVFFKRNVDIENSKYIEIESLENMKEKMLVFEVDKLIINDKFVDNALLGLSLKNFSQKLKTDAIISNKLLEIGETI